ncbi:B-4DMT family transporter [Rhodococcus chondri]|uniref:B-4DMT family transporter n=1 Tax=Rhodococcus chondri TaxID=3065941 RepID=A0ABU7JYE4_9NOCA|nr:B-4DMT family transporter [Rhodococcus sp. CC-R104]MEE2035029.1 B-4DMT family transporter [Rhodococcus sp. CC-R104]
MKPWLLRGLGLALVHVVVRVLLGAALVQWPLQGSVMRWLALVVVILAAVVWAGIDGIRDRRAHPDPDRGEDLTMRWLAAGAVTGLLGGFLTWLADVVLPVSVGVKSLLFELTSGAAFTVLLVFVPAMVAVVAGRFFANRGQKEDGRSRADRARTPEPAATAGNGPAADDSATQSASDGAQTQSAWRNDEAPTETFPAIDPNAPRPER